MTNLQSLAKLMSVSEQDAYAFAFCVRHWMKQGLSMEQAVAQHMASLKQMVELAKTDAIRSKCVDAVYAEAAR
jgi:hypothetical protein